MSFRPVMILIILLLVLAGGFRLACPCAYYEGPNPRLVEGDEAVLETPMANFAWHLNKLAVPFQIKFKSEKTDMRVVDAGDLTLAMNKTSLSEDEKKNILEQYRAARGSMEIVKDLSAENDNEDDDNIRGNKKKEKPVFIEPAIPEKTPAEFKEYMLGAIRYNQGRFDEAKQIWKKLLEKPAAERHYRSTWATFMLGRANAEKNPEEACRWFQKTRELASNGFADSLCLGASSFGEEGRIQFKCKKYPQAMECYLGQHATGDAGAYVSMLIVVDNLFDRDRELLKNAAGNDLARKICTAFLLARGGTSFYDFNVNREAQQHWMSALEGAKVRDVEDADYLAWMSYRAGEFKFANHWLKVASKESKIARWIKAKMFLRDGKLEDAAQTLSTVLKSFTATNVGSVKNDQEVAELLFGGDGHDWLSLTLEDRMLSELAVIRMTQKKFLEAFDAFIQGGCSDDACYLASNVLTIDELKQLVDKTVAQKNKAVNNPAPAKESEEDEATLEDAPEKNALAGETNLTYISSILAERLTRAGRWKEAGPYYMAYTQPRFNAYIKGIRTGRNPKLDAAQRAQALWSAAKIIRNHGVEILHYYYSAESSFSTRFKNGYAKLVPPSDEEIKRIETNNKNVPRDQRFEAADLAWEAAQLMPNESEKTARVLCIAGSWIKYADPKAADRFYKALVKRCRSTRLGQEADKLRWFPREIDEDEPEE